MTAIFRNLKTNKLEEFDFKYFYPHVSYTLLHLKDGRKIKLSRNQFELKRIT